MSPTETTGVRSTSEAAGAAGADPPQLDPATQAYIDQAVEKEVVRRQATSAITTALPKVKEPEIFDGNRARYLSWRRLLQLYVGGVEKDRAITVVVSFMRGPRVDHWRDALLKGFYQDGQWQFESVLDFWDTVDEAWVDPNIAKMAQVRLEACHQGRREAEEFFQEFEELADQAGFQMNDKHVLDILGRNATPWIVTMIYASGHEPKTYVEWRARIKTMDSLWRKGEIVLHHNLAPPPTVANPPRVTPYPPTKPSTLPPGPPPNLPVPPYPTTRRDATGVLYGGRGQPMDVDRACYTCGYKQSERGTCGRRWHEPNRLQKPPKRFKTENARNLWEDPDERQQFDEAIRRYAAEAPDLFKAAGFGVGSA